MELQPPSHFYSRGDNSFSVIAGGHSAPWRFGHRESPWPIFPEGSVPSSELAPWCAEVPAPTAAAGSEMGLSQPPLLPPSLPAPSTTLSAVVHRSRGDTPDLPTPASSQVEFKARWVRVSCSAPFSIFFLIYVPMFITRFRI